MIDLLAPYYEKARTESQVREEQIPFRELEWMIGELPGGRPGLEQTLESSSDVAVIAEHKRMSPSEGEIRPGSSVTWTVDQYKKGGALALSILTQQEHFGGRLYDLVEARHAVDLPILRKDFISNEYQLYEAKACGADAALLIVGGLTDSRLRTLHNEAKNIDLDILVEVHDEAELDRAMDISPKIIGINNRNLSTLEVNLNTTRELIPYVSEEVKVVAESGYSVRKPEHIAELRSMDASAVLMGTALMREEDPSQALSAWLAK